MEPSSSSSVTPEPRLAAPTTLRWVRSSHLLDAMRVNRSQMVSSQCRSSVPPRITRVTRTPERGEDVREFRCHEATSDDHQMLGQLGDAHDGVAGVIVDAGREDGRRDHRPRARRDHHLIGGEFFTGVGAQQIAPVGLNRPEPGVLAVHVDIGCRAPVVLAAQRDRIDAPEDARDDVVPAHPVDVRVDAVARRTSDRLGDLGGVDEHLRRDAPDVEAGAAEGALLADRDPLAGVAVIENASCPNRFR